MCFGQGEGKLCMMCENKGVKIDIYRKREGEWPKGLGGFGREMVLNFEGGWGFLGKS